ncbi:MAG: DUF116 domain-containing protein [bacterium]|nr:DUF116 domain-containing protein [bacterium]
MKHVSAQPTYHSAWQSRLFVLGVALVRLLLRPWGDREQRFIERLTRRENRRVRKHLARRPARTVLLILPRCVRRKGCCPDAQIDLARSLDCHACPLGDMARLCDRFGVHALVAFRSHIAFAMARRERPDLILATACHDRLVKARRTVPEFPALLSPLAGMDRMCVNSGVDLVWFERQLQAVTAPAADRPDTAVSLSGSADGAVAAP